EAGLEFVVSAEGRFYALAGLDGPEFIADEVVKLIINAGVECNTNDVAGGGCGLVRVKQTCRVVSCHIVYCNRAQRCIKLEILYCVAPLGL
ncbi:MAG: hypothetical protein DRP65_11250, partial [Planctomycetota bacterium]